LAAVALRGWEGLHSWRASSRAPPGQGLTKARLWVLHPEHKLLSEWLAAVMFGFNQNINSISASEKDTGAKMYAYGKQKDKGLGSCSLTFQNCGLMVSLPEQRNIN